MKEGGLTIRIMALDVGDRRIGVAISDPTETLARPLTVIPAHQSDLARIAQLVQEHGAERVIVGYPRSLSGGSFGQAKRIEAYAARLSTVLEVPISLWDERFSTTIAERLMKEAGKGGRERRERGDAVAAAVILQDFLDARKRLKEQTE